MGSIWFLMAITCSAKAPHPCKPEILARYPSKEWCLHGEEYLKYRPEPRQIKVWCERQK